MTKGYPTFELIPCIPITDKDSGAKNEDNEIASTHEYYNNDDNTKMDKSKKSSKKIHMNMITTAIICVEKKMCLLAAEPNLCCISFTLHTSNSYSLTNVLTTMLNTVGDTAPPPSPPSLGHSS